MSDRPSIDAYFLEIASVVSTRATCLRNKVGAVIVKDKRILSTGYNGVPHGLPHCTDVGCIRLKEGIPSGTQHERCRATHAEQNAIIQAAIHGVSIAGATLYCTHQPCILCAKMIINAGIVRVVYVLPYPDDDSPAFLAEAGIEIVQLGKVLDSEAKPEADTSEEPETDQPEESAVI